MSPPTKFYLLNNAHFMQYATDYMMTMVRGLNFQDRTLVRKLRAVAKITQTDITQINWRAVFRTDNLAGAKITFDSSVMHDFLNPLWHIYCNTPGILTSVKESLDKIQFQPRSACGNFADFVQTYLVRFFREVVRTDGNWPLCNKKLEGEFQDAAKAINSSTTFDDWTPYKNIPDVELTATNVKLRALIAPLRELFHRSNKAKSLDNSDIPLAPKGYGTCGQPIPTTFHKPPTIGEDLRRDDAEVLEIDAFPVELKSKIERPDFEQRVKTILTHGLKVGYTHVSSETLADLLQVDQRTLEEWADKNPSLVGSVTDDGIQFYRLKTPDFKGADAMSEEPKPNDAQVPHVDGETHGQTGLHCTCNCPHCKARVQVRFNGVQTCPVTACQKQFVVDNVHPPKPTPVEEPAEEPQEESTDNLVGNVQCPYCCNLPTGARFARETNHTCQKCKGTFSIPDKSITPVRVTPPEMDTAPFETFITQFLASDPNMVWRSSDVIKSLGIDIEKFDEWAMSQPSLTRRVSSKGEGKVVYYALYKRLEQKQPEPAQKPQQQQPAKKETNQQPQQQPKKKSNGSYITQQELLAFGMLHAQCDSLVRIMNFYANSLATRHDEAFSQLTKAQKHMLAAVALLQKGTKVQDKKLPDLEEI